MTKSVLIMMAILSMLMFNRCNIYYNMFYTDPEKCIQNAEQKKPYDVIIVPGFPHDSGQVNPVLSQRIKWAYYLYKKGYTKNIIFSGAAVHSPYVEANMMRLFALQLGIKSEHIYTETKAEHTTENLYYSYLIANQLGFKNIAFASEAAQTSFMKPFNRKFKLHVDFIPVIPDSLLKLPVQLNPLDPVTEHSAFIPNFVPLKKRQGALKTLRESRGYRVKKEIREARKLKRKQSNTKS